MQLCVYFTAQYHLHLEALGISHPSSTVLEYHDIFPKLQYHFRVGHAAIHNLRALRMYSSTNIQTVLVFEIVWTKKILNEALLSTKDREICLFLIYSFEPRRFGYDYYSYLRLASRFDRNHGYLNNEDIEKHFCEQCNVLSSKPHQLFIQSWQPQPLLRNQTST